MHDIRFIRENPDAFDAGLARRGADPASARIVEIDTAYRAVVTEAQEAQEQRNAFSKAIGQAKAIDKGADVRGLLLEVETIKSLMPALEHAERERKAELKNELAALPNLPADDVPLGAGETDNVEIARWGEPRSFNFAARDHADIGPPLGLDFETATKMSGSRFVFLRGGIARLNRALGQFMLDTQINAGFVECAPPLLVRDEALFGTGQLPKFAEDLFFAADMSNRERLFWQAMPEDFEGQMAGDPKGTYRDKLESLLQAADTAEQFWLIPTSEVSLTNSVRESILAETDLPLRFTALTPCFRSEAGAAGKDTKGLIRQHQFDKVELVSITRPEDSEAEHERMTAAAEAILQALDLPYRKMLLCTGDMGFAAKKTYDLEVWLPGQDAYREISSCSNCGDFQARRMNARYRPANSDKGAGKGTAFVHTLNGSGLAVGRTLVAVLENYQQADGSVVVPDALRPYMDGIERLVAG